MSASCSKIIEFLTPQNFYQSLYYPTSINFKFNHFFGDIKSVTTSFAEKDMREYADYVNLSLYEQNKKSIEKQYTISSNYDIGCYLAVCSMLYRVLSLTEVSLQHKISTSQWQPHQKAWISTIVAYMPLAVVYLSSGPSTEILVACLVEKAICGVLTLSSSKVAQSTCRFIKEIDVIVKTHPFFARDLVKQNIIVLVRNLSLTLLIVPYLVAPAIQLAHSFLGSESSEHFHAKSAAIEVCHASIIAYSKEPTLYENIANDVVWVGGKLMVDLFIVLLHKNNIVKDIRYPLQALINVFDKSKFA